MLADQVLIFSQFRWVTHWPIATTKLPAWKLLGCDKRRRFWTPHRLRLSFGHRVASSKHRVSLSHVVQHRLPRGGPLETQEEGSHTAAAAAAARCRIQGSHSAVMIIMEQLWNRQDKEPQNLPRGFLIVWPAHNADPCTKSNMRRMIIAAPIMKLQTSTRADAIVDNGVRHSENPRLVFLEATFYHSSRRINGSWPRHSTCFR